MRRVIVLVPALAAALAASPVRGGIYRYVDESGTVVYTDKPRPGAEKVELPGISVYRSPPVPRAGTPAAGGDRRSAEPGGYGAVRIVEPGHDQAFWSAEGIVTVRIESEPPLNVKAGHRYRLYLDGQAVEGLLQSGAVQLRNVTRGTHSLRVEVVDAGSGQVLAASEPVTFHLLQPGLLSPTRRR